MNICSVHTGAEYGKTKMRGRSRVSLKIQRILTYRQVPIYLFIEPETTIYLAKKRGKGINISWIDNYRYPYIWYILIITPTRSYFCKFQKIIMHEFQCSHVYKPSHLEHHDAEIKEYCEESSLCWAALLAAFNMLGCSTWIRLLEANTCVPMTHVRCHAPSPSPVALHTVFLLLPNPGIEDSELWGPSQHEAGDLVAVQRHLAWGDANIHVLPEHIRITSIVSITGYVSNKQTSSHTDRNQSRR